MLRALRGAVNALDQRDHELADEVIAFDDDVDARYIAIEEGIQSLLARQTPVASDLRLVLAILHVNLHLERMADYCVTIAKLSKLVPEVDPGPRFIEGFEEMGSRCEEMIRVALDVVPESRPRRRRISRRSGRARRSREQAHRGEDPRPRRRSGHARVRIADGRGLPRARADR